MNVPMGELEYRSGAIPCSGMGVSWSSGQLDTALDERIIPLVFDDEGMADINEILSGLAQTEFEHQNLRRILASTDDVEDWRVGEAIAEAYLADHRSCEFPWPSGRDIRKRGSSLPGADLVGFTRDNGGDCFAFGEVKTSSEERYPPNAVYGRTGLNKQLEDLRNQECIRRGLIIYLGHRAKSASWNSRFQGAARRYLNNNSDVHIYGILIRDVAPHEDDIRVRVTNLATGCPSGTTIELLAVYLPQGRIAGIGSAVVARSTGADA